MVGSFRILTSFLESSGLRLSLGVLIFCHCRAHTWSLLLQYMSKKFGWEYSTVRVFKPRKEKLEEWDCQLFRLEFGATRIRRVRRD